MNFSRLVALLCCSSCAHVDEFEPYIYRAGTYLVGTGRGSYTESIYLHKPSALNCIAQVSPSSRLSLLDSDDYARIMRSLPPLRPLLVIGKGSPKNSTRVQIPVTEFLALSVENFDSASEGKYILECNLTL